MTATSASAGGKAPKANGATPPPASPRTSAADVFADMEKVRAEQADPLIGTEEVLVNVAVRKPKSGEFFRVHTDPDMSMPVSIFDDRDDQTIYYVLPELRPLMGEQVRQAMLTACINQAGIIFLWPIKLAGDGGGSREWANSAIRAATLAKSKWVRVIGELRNQAYRVFAAKGELPDPVWPTEHTLQDYLILGFEGRIIDAPDHVVIQRLQGLIGR
jgi:hypothetical protein